MITVGPSPTAAAAPVLNAGVGSVIADLGTVTQFYRPGFSFDGAYFAYFVPAGDRCDLRVYDLSARKLVNLAHALVCDSFRTDWAPHADTLVWQVDAAAGNVTEYAWDADPGQVTVLAGDAHVFVQDGEDQQPSVSADGRFLAFIGWSDAHPAPAVDPVGDAGYIYDRTMGVSLPLSKTGVHVQFREWSPVGDHFVASSGGPTASDPTGACVGSPTSCRVLPGVNAGYGTPWSPDGTAVLVGGPADRVYDFTDDSLSTFPARAGDVDYVEFLGNDRMLGYLDPGGVVWNRRTGEVSTISSPGPPDASPTGRYLLFHDAQPDAYRYLNVVTGAAAPAAYRGTSTYNQRDGYWAEDGSTYIGVGPGGCSSLRQWTVATNTVSLLGPPGLRTCYSVPNPREIGPRSSASGRFALFDKVTDGTGLHEYVVDLRRHVLLGPLQGYGQAFAPAGSDTLAVGWPLDYNTQRLLLVDPRPVPDVDDKPRWSSSTPTTGSRFELEVGEQATIQLGASDQQQTPVNLYFRWRTATGVPVASPPQGWSCDRRRLAAGATVADCTFAPPEAHTDVRFLDVSTTNYSTGAQSDTRSYLIGTKRVAAPHKH